MRYSHGRIKTINVQSATVRGGCHIGGTGVLDGCDFGTGVGDLCAHGNVNLPDFSLNFIHYNLSTDVD